MSTSFTTARQTLGRELGWYYIDLVSSATASIVSTSYGLLSSVLPTDHVAYAWLFAPSVSAPKVKRVTLTGLDPTTGALTLEGSLGSAPAQSSVIEISPLLPPVHASLGESFSMSLQECLNRGASHLLIKDDALSLSLVNLQRSYGLVSSWPWLDRASRLEDVRQLDVLGTSYVSTHRRWEVREGAEGASLFFPAPYRFSSGSYTNRLVAWRPGDTKIKVGGAWGESTVGLVNETDETAVPLPALICAAKVFAYQALRERGSSADRAIYDELYERQLRLCRAINTSVVRYDAENEIDPSVPAGAPAPVGAA